MSDDSLLTQACMLPADLQAAAPAQAAQSQQATAAPGGPGRPPTPGTQPGMWPGTQPAAVGSFPGPAAHQLGSQSMTARQPSPPAHLRMPQGMAVQPLSSQAQQAAYMQQPRSMPVGHLHQSEMRQQQAQGGGHQGAVHGLLHEGMLLPGQQEVGTFVSEERDSTARGALGWLPLSELVSTLQRHCCSSRVGLAGLPFCEHLSHAISLHGDPRPASHMLTVSLFHYLHAPQTATQAAATHKGLTTAVTSLAV